MHVYIDEGASKCCDSSQKPRARQQEVQGGEGQSSRIRHALLHTVIHLHTD